MLHPAEQVPFDQQLLLLAALLLFVAGSLTGSVLRHFEDELQAMVALTFFVPLLIGNGGNAGTQTTTIIRALAVGEGELNDGRRALWHELRVGLLLGLTMAVMAYRRAVTWGASRSLAVAVSVAIYAIVVWTNGLVRCCRCWPPARTLTRPSSRVRS